MFKLLNADCLSALHLIEKESIDLIITDPPYGMNYVSNWRKDKHSKIFNDDNLDFVKELPELFNRVLKENSSMYIFCSQYCISEFIHEFNKKFKLKNILTWVKNNHTSGDLKGAYGRKTEYILYYHKGRKILNGKRDVDVLEFKKTLNNFHPTEKPVDLLEYLLTKSSAENDNILDPFMGSGSTGVACKNLRRNFLGIEKEHRYYEIAKKRIN